MAGHLLLEAQQPTLVAGFHQLVDQGGGGGEADRHALLAGGQPEAEGHMGLAGAARAEGDDVLAPVDPFASGQLQDLHLVEPGDRLEVEAVEALGDRELRGLDAAFHHASFAIDQFQLDQSGQEPHVVQALGRALAGELVILPEEGRQLQGLQVMREQDLRRLGHAASPDIRHM